MKNKILIFIITLFAMQSCYKDIPLYDPATFKPQLTVNALAANDSVLKVTVANSAIPERLTYDSWIKDATVKLYENGNYISTLNPVIPDTQSTYDYGFYNPSYMSKIPYYTSGFKPQIGKAYTIEVTAKDGRQASGSFYIPKPVPLQDVRIDLTGYDTSYVADFKLWHVALSGTVTITFQDPDTANYYAVYGFMKDYQINMVVDTNTGDTTYVADSVYREVGLWDQQYQDNLFDENSEVDVGLPFGSLSWPFYGSGYNDAAFNGHQVVFRYDFAAYLLTPDLDSVYIYIGLASLTEDYYRFFETYTRYDNFADNPFVEPINVYTNVKDGLGIVAGLGTYVEKIKINLRGR